MMSRIPHMHESSITSCQFNMLDDRIITTSTDKTTKFFDLVSHRCTMTLRYILTYRDRLAHLSIDDARLCNERSILYNRTIRKGILVNELIDLSLYIYIYNDVII
jgi:hypothetical protein